MADGIANGMANGIVETEHMDQDESITEADSMDQDEHAWWTEARQTILSTLDRKECAITRVLETLVDKVVDAWSRHKQQFADDEHIIVHQEKFISTFLHKMPYLFTMRYGSVLKKAIMATLAEQQHHHQPLAVVHLAPLLSTQSQRYAQRYQQCFHQWLADPSCYSITTTFPPLLEKQWLIAMKDLLTLQVFVLATCQRVKNDNMVCLSITGLSSIGKSSLIENPLENISFNATNADGVNRFNVDNKSILLLHDTLVDILVAPRDANVYRCATRGEVCKVKTFGNVATLPPIHVLLTSNQSIHTHYFPLMNTSLKGKVESALLPKRHHSLKESVRAMQNRFLEIYFCKRPVIDPAHFPDDGHAFRRHHMIAGLYATVVDLLQRHAPAAFYTKMIPLYCIYGLVHYMSLYNDAFMRSVDDRRHLLMTLSQLQQKFQ